MQASIKTMKKRDILGSVVQAAQRKLSDMG
jgi:hypothetical protein